MPWRIILPLPLATGQHSRLDILELRKLSLGPEVIAVIHGQHDGPDAAEQRIRLPHLVLDDGVVVRANLAVAPDLQVERVALPDELAQVAQFHVRHFLASRPWGNSLVGLLDGFAEYLCDSLGLFACRRRHNDSLVLPKTHGERTALLC